MERIRPGRYFEVEYGDGEKISVICLSVTGKADLTDLLQGAEEPGVNPFRVLMNGLKMAKPDITDEVIETLAMEDINEIIQAALVGQMLSEDDKKKLESQP